MGIFSRFTDIINSNLNAILDRAEEPEKMIRLIIQEMEDTLVEVRTTAARTIAEKKEINRRLNSLNKACDEWETKAELALNKDREDLAKAALVEKAKLQQSAEALQAELTHLDDSLSRGDADVARLEAKLAEARAKQKTIRARHDTIDARIKVRRQLHNPRVDDAFARFESVERRLDAAEGELEAYDLGQHKTLAEEIDDLETDSVIEEQLAALKERLAKAGPTKEKKS